VSLAAASDRSKGSAAELKGQKKVDRAKAIGLALAKACLAKGITKVVFDRNGYMYHGRVRALAEGAREGGLDF
jgi:large subunit ribosomal protein L18